MHFDLILMDVQMPEMDGFEATRLLRFRQKASEAPVPIIALTAHAMKGDRERCLAAGMNEYISKPVSLKSLQEAICRVMEARTPAMGASIPDIEPSMPAKAALHS